MGSKSLLLGALFLLVVAVAAFYMLSAQKAFAPLTDESSTSTQSLANPASTNCVTLGGSLEIRDEASGQVGYCHLKDGRVCEEWALFRTGNCSNG